MEKTFGETLRSIRLDREVGLRELARLINKSPGYLSDVENGRARPPSEAVILDIAAALGAGQKELLVGAKKVHPELSDFVSQQPEAADFLRMAKDRKFDEGDWGRLTQLAKIANLGKDEGEK